MERAGKRANRLRHTPIPDGVSAPRGSKHFLANAVQRLAPHEGIWIKDDGTKQQLSKDLAIELLHSVARRYNTNSYLASRADRFSAIVRKLKAIEKHADRLAQELRDLKDVTATVIFNAAELSRTTKTSNKIIDQADMAAIVPRGRRSSAWARRASSLSRTTLLVRELLERDRRGGGKGNKDKGGNVNHFTEDQGTPYWALFTDAIYIYEGFKPGKATGTEHGDLHLFVDELLEYATGREPKSTIRPLRKLLVATREQERRHARSQAINAELEEMLVKTDSDPNPDLTRFVQLSEEFRENEKAYAALTSKTWPHRPGPRFD